MTGNIAKVRALKILWANCLLENKLDYTSPLNIYTNLSNADYTEDININWIKFNQM